MKRNDFANKKASEIIEVLSTNPGNSITSVFDQASDNTEGKYILIKDIHNNTMMPATMASEMLLNYQSCYNATIIDNLIKDGYSIVGSTNLDEYAMGSTTKTSFFGPVDNVLGDQYISGGSSGGSAYAIAKGLVPFATGTDTGGSIRQPAAFNGIYGLKPTYGLVSRYGTIAFASSFDTIGPMTSDLYENASLLNTLASNDYKDQTNFVPECFDALKTFNQPIRGMKIGVMRKWLESGIDEEIKSATENKIEQLKSLGAEIIDVDVPLTKYSFSLYITLAYAEGSSNLNRYDGMRFGLKMDDANPTYEAVRSHFGTEVKKRLIIGTYMLSSEHSIKYFKKAQQLRQLMCEQFDQVFDQVDCIIGPTTPQLAFDANKGMSDMDNYLSDEFIIPANLVGFPSLNIPIGTANDGRFIGMQLMANKYQEAVLYQVANNLEGGSDV